MGCQLNNDKSQLPISSINKREQRRHSTPIVTGVGITVRSYKNKDNFYDGATDWNSIWLLVVIFH